MLMSCSLFRCMFILLITVADAFADIFFIDFACCPCNCIVLALAESQNGLKFCKWSLDVLRDQCCNDTLTKKGAF